MEPMASNRSQYSVAQNLPDDLLKEVFMWGVFGSELYQIAPANRTFEFGSVKAQSGSVDGLNPILAGHVCRSWRHAALSAPLLWSSIEVNSDRFKPRDLEILNAWLERSAESNLYLKFFFCRNTSDTFPQAIQLAFEHHHRWKKVAIQLPPLEVDTISPMFRSWSEATFERLVHFSISMTPISQQEVEEHESNPFHMFYTYPSLRSLHFSHNTPLAWVQGAPLPQLTSLSIEKLWSLPDTLALLWECKALEALDFGVNDSWDNSHQPIFLSKIDLLNLKSLALTNGEHLDWFTNALVTPQLETLHVRDTGGPFSVTLPSPLVSIIGFVYRCECPLKSLSLHVVTEEVERYFIRLLSLPSLSGLEELRLYNSTITTKTIVALTITETASLFPGLRFLRFDFCECSHYLLFSMIQSRSASLRRIEGDVKGEFSEVPTIPNVTINLWSRDAARFTPFWPSFSSSDISSIDFMPRWRDRWIITYCRLRLVLRFSRRPRWVKKVSSKLKAAGRGLNFTLR